MEGPAQASKQTAKSEPLPRQDNANHERHGGRSSADVKSSGGDSPLHPRSTGGRGSGSQPSSFDSLQGSSGRTRHRHPSRPPPNKAGGGPAVPEFGAWNKNPEQAEGYTDVFNQVLTEKRTPGHNPTPTPHPIPTKQPKGNWLSCLFKCCSSHD